MKNERFNLKANPFYVLKANYEADHAYISELADDAVFEEIFNAEEIHRAQQSLVTPKLRLVEELSWLPELSDAQVASLVAQLATDEVSGLAGVITHLPELAKANILAHLSGMLPVEQSLVHSLIATWEEIDPSHIFRVINEGRRVSGFPAVNDPQLRSALKELEIKHSETVAASIWSSSRPGALMETIVETGLCEHPSSVFLEHLVRSYDSRSETDLAHINAQIDRHIEQAKGVDRDLQKNVRAISELLVAWDEINQPVQVYEQHQGHEEGRSKRVYENVRALCLDLANAHGKYSEARLLSEALLRTFPELESVAEVLKGDVEQLEALDEQKRMSELLAPLADACEAAKADKQFKKLIKRNGFTAARRGGTLSRLVTEFEQSIINVKDPSVAYLMVRDIALFINNDRDDPETAFRLVNGLLSHEGTAPPEDIQKKLKGDRATLHRNWKMMELDRKSGDLSGMLLILNEMLEFAEGSSRAEILQIKQKIERKKRRARIEWGIYAAIAVVVGVLALNGTFFSSSSKSSFAPATSVETTRSSSATISRSATNAFVEEKPPAGSGRTLTKSQVRYCTFQGDRLDFMRSLSMTNYQIDRFNQLINDYNLRCSSFRYRSGVLSSVQREAKSRSDILQAEARRIVSSW